VKEIVRGGVYSADLNPVVGHEQAGRRPVLVLSDNRFNLHSKTAVVMPLTSQKPRAGYPFAIELGFVGAEKLFSYIKPGQVRTISVARIGRYLGSTDTAVDQCLDALLQICGRPVKGTRPSSANDGG
jgi:mRNA interferase MazF